MAYCVSALGLVSITCPKIVDRQDRERENKTSSPLKSSTKKTCTQMYRLEMMISSENEITS